MYNNKPLTDIVYSVIQHKYTHYTIHAVQNINIFAAALNLYA